MADTPSQKIAKAMIARFPISHANVPYTNVTGGAHPFDVGVENIKISINKTAPDNELGRLDTTVRLHTGSNLSGFKGGAYYRLLDDKGNVVWALLGKLDTVDGKLNPGGKPNRVDIQETEFIPIDVLTSVYSIEIFPSRVEDDELQKLKDAIAKFCEGATTVRDGLKKAGASIAEIIATIKAL